eukprot:3015337-Pyramimonas_sp.AAC.2
MTLSHSVSKTGTFCRGCFATKRPTSVCLQSTASNVVTLILKRCGCWNAYVRELEPPGELSTSKVYPFEFTRVEMQHESYNGINVRLRRATVPTDKNPTSKEADLIRCRCSRQCGDYL